MAIPIRISMVPLTPKLRAINHRPAHIASPIQNLQPEPSLEEVVVASDPAFFDCMRVVQGCMVIPDGTVAPHIRPSPRPRAQGPVGGHLVQYSTAAFFSAFPTEDDHV